MDALLSREVRSESRAGGCFDTVSWVTEHLVLVTIEMFSSRNLAQPGVTS